MTVAKSEDLQKPEVFEWAKTELLPLLLDIQDSEPCWFDHNGGCQAHGYISLRPGETCPQADVKELISALLNLDPRPYQNTKDDSRWPDNGGDPELLPFRPRPQYEQRRSSYAD